MAFEPKWSEQLSSTGGPIQPLRAGSVRNGFLGDITQSLTTDVQLRGRYVSIFTWGRHFVGADPAFENRDLSEKKEAIYTLEKLLAVTTLYYQEQKNVPSGTNGLVGGDRLRSLNILDDDPIDLSAFEVRDDDNAVGLTKTNRYYLLLREKETQLGATGVGKELAEIFDKKTLPHRERIIDILDSKSVTHDEMDKLKDLFSFQALYADPDSHDQELDILTRVFLGLTSWDDSLETASLEPLPESLDCDVYPYLRYESGERAFSDDLRDDVESEVLRMQRAWATFMLQVIAEYNTASETDQYILDNRAREVFSEFRSVAQLYWMQQFTSSVLRLHLWFCCEYLERALPGAVSRSQLEADLTSDAVANSAAAAFDLNVESTENKAGQRRVARELILYGQTPKTTPRVVRPETFSTKVRTVGDLRTQVDTALPSSWDDAHTMVTMSSLIEAINDTANRLDDVSPQETVRDRWLESLGYSLTLLFMISNRYQRMTSATPLLGAYMESAHSEPQASLPKLSSYFDAKADETPLVEVAVDTVMDLCITLHDKIVRDRLGSSGPIRLSLAYDVEQDAFRYIGGAIRLRRDYLRYRRMQQVLLDLNLVTSRDDDAKLTSRGEDILARARRTGGGL